MQRCFYMTHADHAPELPVKFGRIIDNVEIRMANPGFRCPIIQRFGQLEILTPTRMVLHPKKQSINDSQVRDIIAVYIRRIKVFGPFGRRDHMDDLIVPCVPQLDRVPAVGLHQPLPILLGND